MKSVNLVKQEKTRITEKNKSSANKKANIINHKQIKEHGNKEKHTEEHHI